MTKTEWPEVIPGFDVLKWKAETQARILRETEGMTDEEILAYFRKASERAKRRREEFAERQKAEGKK